MAPIFPLRSHQHSLHPCTFEGTCQPPIPSWLRWWSIYSTFPLLRVPCPLELPEVTPPGESTPRGDRLR